MLVIGFPLLATGLPPELMISVGCAANRDGNNNLARPV